MSTIATDAAASKSSNGNNLDVFVHRVRHVNYIPKGVLCLRPAPNPPFLSPEDDAAMIKSNGWQKQRQGMLAIAREGGFVELVDARNKFISVANVPGMPSREIGDLAWLQSSTKATPTATLVGGSSTDGTLFAVDYAHQRHSSVLALGGGAIFCLESLVMGGAASSFVAAGCEDGSIRIVSYQGNSQECSSGRHDDTQLFTVEYVLSTTSTVLSLAWWHFPQFSSTSTSKKPTHSHPSLVGYLYAGCADGTIRRYECTRKGAFSQYHDSATPRLSWKTSPGRITVDHAMGSQTPTKVWSLICVQHTQLPSNNSAADNSSDPLLQHTLVSGNSLGMLQFWEPSTMTLLSSMRQSTSTGHEAHTQGSAVLCLALNSRHDRLYASGEDNRIVCFARTSAATASWVVTEAFRPHTHVVQSLAIISSSSSVKDLKGRETLVSGGMDTKLCTIPVTSTGTSLSHSLDVAVPRRIRDSARPKHLYLWPSNDGTHPIQISGEMGIMAVMRFSEHRIDFYRLAASSSHPAAFRSTGGTGSIPPIKLFSIELDTHFNLHCFAYSEDGSLLAVSDGSGTTLFQISYDLDHGGIVMGGNASPVMSLHDDDNTMSSSTIKDGKIAEEILKMLPCCSMAFSPSGRHLIAAASSGPLTVFHLDPETHCIQESFTCTDHMEDDCADEGVKDYNWSPQALLPMTRLTLSSDSRWLVAGRNTIGEHAIHVFRLPSLADGIDGIRCTFHHWWRVPVLHHTPNGNVTNEYGGIPHTCVKFAGDSSLVVAYADNTFFIVDVETKSLSDWSQEMTMDSHPCKTLPVDLILRKDYPTGCAINPSTPNKFLLGGHGYFCAVDADREIPHRSQFYPLQQRPPIGKFHGGLEDDSVTATTASSPFKRKRDRLESVGSATATHNRGRDNDNCTLCLRFNSILHMDFFRPNELLIVEQPWLPIANALPDPLARHVYGS